MYFFIVYLLALIFSKVLKTKDNPSAHAYSASADSALCSIEWHVHELETVCKFHGSVFKTASSRWG